jgi:hypothetical protein
MLGESQKDTPYFNKTELPITIKNIDIMHNISNVDENIKSKSE